MNALTRKKISRTALRNHCKKLEADISSILDNFPDDGVHKLKVLKVTYEKQIEKINTVSDEISMLIETEQDLTADLEQCLVLNETFYETLERINEKLSICQQAVSDTKPKITSPPISVKTNDTEANTRLPKIELKPFNGDILHWQTFWDNFESNIHLKTKLSDGDKSVSYTHLTLPTT